MDNGAPPPVRWQGGPWAGKPSEKGPYIGPPSGNDMPRGPERWLQERPPNSEEMDVGPPSAGNVPGPRIQSLPDRYAGKGGYAGNTAEPTLFGKGGGQIEKYGTPSQGNQSEANRKAIDQHFSPESQLDLHRSTYEDLTLAKVYTRKKAELCLAFGYKSEDDDTDEDEEDGRMYTERQWHDHGALKYMRTYQVLNWPGRPGATFERLVEEKHYSPDGVCMLDHHFALGQPYLSRKKYYWNQRLQSEQLFFVECERTMKSRKSGHWREYYESGQIKAEVQYDENGVRRGFCKRYGEDGSILWVKDYTKQHMMRIEEFNEKHGKVAFSLTEAAKLLGFADGKLPPTVDDVNRAYRKNCAPLHPDKAPDPDSTEKFIQISRAREVLVKHFDEMDQ